VRVCSCNGLGILIVCVFVCRAVPHMFDWAELHPFLSVVACC
jgi:hypothetical protein